MKNSERCAKEIFELACNGAELCVKDGKPASCRLIECKECDFEECNHGLCSRSELFKTWCNSEYEEPKITIPEDAKVDTKILVSNDGENWCRRHFAKIKDGILYAWENGSTSWTNNFGTNAWKYGKLAEESDGT